MIDERLQKRAIVPAQPGYEFLSYEFMRSDHKPSISRTAIVAWEIRFDGNWETPDVFPLMLNNVLFASIVEGLESLDNIVCGILRPDGRVEEIDSENSAFGTLTLYEHEAAFREYIGKFFVRRKAEEEQRRREEE